MRPGREFQPPLEQKRVLLYTFCMLTKKNVVKVIDALEKEYPDAACALDYGTLYQLLVSVMLSAQTTDASVNKATPALFAAAPDAASMVKLSEEEIQDYIRSPRRLRFPGIAAGSRQKDRQRSACGRFRPAADRRGHPRVPPCEPHRHNGGKRRP